MICGGTYGVVYPLNHQPDHLLNDIKHDHKSAILAEDNGKMDKFSLIHGAIQNGVDEADLPSLTSFDGQSNDMFTAFNFNQTPLPPLTIAKAILSSYQYLYITSR